MMFVVLDPGFFREDGIASPVPSTREAAGRRLRARLDDANRLLAAHNAALVVDVGAVAWFDAIYQHEVRVIERAADRPLKQSLDRFREHRRRGRALPNVAITGKMWGIPMMADWPAFGRPWSSELVQVLGAAVIAAASKNASVVFLSHRIVGRNVTDRSTGGVQLVEVLRWRLSVSIQGAPSTVVPCVSRLRHIEVPWAVRMDDRLPDQQGHALHPYCPPDRWKNSQTAVSCTHQSRPCWIDAQGQYWARPSTGGGYHWDVWLNAVQSEHVGLSQINVTQYGAPANQGQPGDLHHVPRPKRQALRSDSGWRCPVS